MKKSIQSPAQKTSADWQRVRSVGRAGEGKAVEAAERIAEETPDEATKDAEKSSAETPNEETSIEEKWD